MVNRRKKIILETPKRKRRRRRRSIIKTIIVVLSVVLLLSLVIGFFRLSSLRVSDISVLGADTVDAAAVKAEAEQVASGNRFLVIPKNHVFLYPKHEIKEKIQNNFKEIKEVNVESKNFNKIEIQIAERAADAFYCIFECFLIDESGYVYKTAEGITPDGKVTFKEERSEMASSSPLGTYPLKTETYKGLESFGERLASLKLELLEVQLKVNEEVTIKTRQGDLIVSIRKPIDEQFALLETALSQGVFNDGVGGIRSFGYIDLRFGNKIFYKLDSAQAQGAELASTSTATSTPQ